MARRLMPCSWPTVADALATAEASITQLRADLERREIEVRLQVDFTDNPEQSIDRHFWVGQYDFPMMDNVQLPHGLRASVVVTEITVPANPDDRALNSFASVHLVVFPAASASLALSSNRKTMDGDREFEQLKSKLIGIKEE